MRKETANQDLGWYKTRGRQVTSWERYNDRSYIAQRNFTAELGISFFVYDSQVTIKSPGKISCNIQPRYYTTGLIFIIKE